MATIQFRIKPPSKTVKKARPTSFIKVRVNQQECSTNIKIDRKAWSQPKQKVKLMNGIDYADDVNTKLDELRLFLNNELTTSRLTDTEITQIWLKDQINSFFNKPTSSQSDSQIYFSEFMREYIKLQKSTINKKTGQPRAKRTIQDYETKLKKIKEYQKSKGIRLKLNDINLDFLDKFTFYMNFEESIDNWNTIKGYVELYKQVCRAAKLKRLNVSPEIESPDFYVPNQPTYDFALTEQEIDLIYNHDFSENERLDNARDWLIIGLWTGLRVSDFLTLTKEEITDKFITKTAKKTKIPVIIPIHKQLKSVLAKRNGQFPRKISDVKFNLYIKEVCLKVGLTDLVKGAKMTPKQHKGKTIHRKEIASYPKHELITSHICRRTFATIHYGKIDTLAIMQITGHKTETQFVKYIKIPSEEYAQRMMDYWHKYYDNAE